MFYQSPAGLFERVRLLTRRRVELGARGWSLVVAALAVFVVVIEIVAIRFGIHGPIDRLAHDFVGRAEIGEIKLAGLMLALVCMPSRLRWWTFGAAVALETVWNVQRVVVGHDLTVGNGILWALVGTVAFAVWKLRDGERTATLKAVGLGMMLIVMGRVGDVWLVLSTKANAKVLDGYVELADRALGSPSWAVGRIVSESTVLTQTCGRVYMLLPVGAAVIAFFQLRNSARDGFPRHHIVRTFLLIGMIGPLIYFIFPVVGPTYAFGHDVAGAGWQDVWPWFTPDGSAPTPTYFDQHIARNCMPSLHTAWAMAIFLHGWRGSTASRVFGTFWLIATTGATLGFGYHYAVDVLAGMVFTLTLEAALTRPETGVTRVRMAVVALGAGLFSALLLMTRFAAPWLATGGALSVLLLVGPVVVAAAGFLLVERPALFSRTDPADGPCVRPRRRTPQRTSGHGG
ncbi:inositol phosphorylceramide synthase [Gordonia spumicola]|uniref:Inositol phosphorylceramide synthase n=1 Tax=Gordonia spumicola TaxID=589161 RepID=A0A7I9V382_9ACTN|nr:phosphatase PAP2 family protein [Gordonia spumicola]GED99633.1 inositol phosphorylceramide synthase [Gordonia spumicola]